MSLLVRKIDNAKWMQNNILNNDTFSVEDVSADAITSLKTSGNALSAWQVAEEAIEDAVLAIVSSHQHLDAIDVVCLDPSSLESNGIKLQSTPGSTPLKDKLIGQHIDICDLTYRTLGTVAEQIVHVLKEGKVLRYTKGNIKKLLYDAINRGRLQKDDLDESLRKRL